MELRKPNNKKNYNFRIDKDLYLEVFKGLERGKSKLLDSILKNYIKESAKND